MAVPKQRTSKARKNARRASNKNLKTPRFQRCPNCSAPRLTHRVCGECGHYRSKQVIEVWEY